MPQFKPIQHRQVREETVSSAAWDHFLDRFVAWAQNRPDISVAALLGSRARTYRPADEWSDMDILIVTTKPEFYLSSSNWVQEIGTPRITFLEKTGTGDEMERRVLFEGGLDVDFAIIPRERVSGDLEGFYEVARRGIRALLDREGILARALEEAPAGAPQKPMAEFEYLELVNDFWYHAVWTTKKLCRGELWTAKACCDSYMKRLLLSMIEIYTRATKGKDHDTWHEGRFLEQWADPRALQGLGKAFAHYDKADVKRALLATMELFRRLAKDAAQRLGFTYPTDGDSYATELVENYLSTMKH